MLMNSRNGTKRSEANSTTVLRNDQNFGCPEEMERSMKMHPNSLFLPAGRLRPGSHHPNIGLTHCQICDGLTKQCFQHTSERVAVCLGFWN